MPARPTTSHSSPTWVISSKVSACGVKIPSKVGSTTSSRGEAAQMASSTSLRLML